MYPKLHQKGSSFKGIATYLLHDKNKAQTSERVAWTDTRNLATDDAHLAWRIQAATAMDQRRLKQAAGVGMAGRKSDKHVLHFTLSWHPEQSPDREEMLQAADDAIAALGATDRQSLIVAHNDTKHPHIHIVCNRVSPTDGRHLSSSKEKEKLSDWAGDYENKTGVYCHNRVVNKAARKRKMALPKAKRGAFVRAEKDTPRHLVDAPRSKAANDNDEIEKLQAEQKAKDHALALLARNQAKQQQMAWQRLTDAHSARKEALARKLRSQRTAAEKTAFEALRADRVALNKRQAAERETFNTLESSFFGRLGNAVKVSRLSAQVIEGDHSGIIKRTYNIMHNAGRRKGYFEEAQKRARDTLQRKEDEQYKANLAPHQKAHDDKLTALRVSFLREREDLTKHQAAQRTALQSDWKKRNVERETAMAEITRRRDILAAAKTKPPVKPIYDRVARPAPPVEKSGDQRTGGKAPTRPISKAANDHNAPLSRIEQHRETLKQKQARSVEDIRELLKRPAREQDNDRDKDR